ncbi:MAG: response regulator, partial [Leptospiraceae bacterium]|nr:response regulator [Leptospiraceae bacterium]
MNGNMKNYLHTIIFRLLVLLSLSGYAQYQNFRFTHLTTDHGLSQSNITSILQDHKGFMWFGTFNGLNRYDGYEFEIFNYNHNDTASISHNYISSLLEDRNGDLWVGTGDGLNRFDDKTNRFVCYKNRPGDPGSIADNQIETILEDSRGRLWIGTRDSGLDRFDPASQSFRHHLHHKDDPQSLSSNRIEKLFEDSAGNLWIAHRDGSIDIFGGADDAAANFSVQRGKITGFPITAIVETADRHIWIGTQGDGLYRVTYNDGQLRTVTHYANTPANPNSISSNIVLCLMVENDQRLWIGTEDDGINILNIATGQIDYIRHEPLNQSSLNHDSIWQIYQDRTGNIWIGTYAYGVNLLSGNKSFIHHYYHQTGNQQSLSHNMVNAFWEAANRNIWIATDGGGINLFDRANHTFTHYNRQNTNVDTDVFVSLCQDRKGRLWVGSWTNGLYRFNPAAGRFTRYTAETHGLGSNRILHILEDRTSGLWLATFYGGVTYFNPDSQTVTVYNTENSGLGDDYTRVVHQDFTGNLWIGTDSGVDYFNPRTGRFTNFQHDVSDTNSLSKGFVHSIVQTGDSTIWIGTTGGLNRFDPATGRFIHYSTDNGLPNNEIKCIVEDNDGNLWVSTNNGISRFNRESATFKNYDISDGLQGNEFNVRSSWKTRAGELIFGGNNGFNIFDPAELKNNDAIPPVLLTEFKIFNRPVDIGGQDKLLTKHISETDAISLAYWQTVFSIGYVALNYVSPEKNQYAYMMEGFDSDWNYVGGERAATYTNLDPGDYVFRVKASNNDGLWNQAGTALRITVTPPFWKTWWAYLLMALLALTAVFLVINYFISRQRLENALKIEHLELEKMYELDRIKTQFFSNISHEFYAPLTLILGPLERLISSQKHNHKIQESLKLIHRSAKRLQRMTNQLKNFQKLESGDVQLRLARGDMMLFIRDIVQSFQDHAIEHRIDYRFQAAQARFTTWFDADKLDKIIYNLLSNAFKYTPDGGRITVDAAVIQAGQDDAPATRDDVPGQYVEITVRDSGIGIPGDQLAHIFDRHYRVARDHDAQPQGSGIGLAFVLELVKLYQGDISVESAEGKGTQFTVQIPVDEQFLEERQLVSEFSIADSETYDSDEFAGIEDIGSGNGGAAAKSPEHGMPVLLIVEDDAEIRSFIKDSLQLKYRIFCAPNGAEGIQMATRLVPDLVISDVKMPEVGGIELCNRLKEDEKTSHIPIILLTAYTAHEYKIEGLSRGADAYLLKPFNIDELEVQIVNLLQTRKKLKEKYCRQILLEPAQVEIEDMD